MNRPVESDYTSMTAYTRALEVYCDSLQPEHEPIGEAHLMQKGFTHCIWSEYCVPVGTKFYTHPPQRTWIGLTDEEIQSCWDGDLSPYQMQCIREIEAKLKEKTI
jgi:hypothetical protein